MNTQSVRGGLDPLLLRRAAVLVDRGAASVVHEHRLTVDQWRMLALLVAGGKSSMAALCTELSLTGATATRVADHLVTEGLVRREIDDTDRRRVVLRASRKGRELHGHLAEEVEIAQERELDTLVGAEPERLAPLLGRPPARSVFS